MDMALDGLCLPLYRARVRDRQCKQKSFTPHAKMRETDLMLIMLISQQRAIDGERGKTRSTFRTVLLLLLLLLWQWLHSNRFCSFVNKVFGCVVDNMQATVGKLWPREGCDWNCFNGKGSIKICIFSELQIFPEGTRTMCFCLNIGLGVAVTEVK